MPNLNPNSTDYTHSYEPNTNDLTMAIYQNFDSTDSMIVAIVAYRLNNDNAASKLKLDRI